MTTEPTSTPPKPNGTESKAEAKIEPAVATALRLLIAELDALAHSLPLTMGVAQVVEREAEKTVGEFLKHCAIPDPQQEKSFLIPADQVPAFRPLDKRFQQAKIAKRIIPRTFAIALVSHFDAFLGRLIRAVFELRPEMLVASEKNIPFSQLLQFSSLEEAKSHLIEKEIEAVLRESHAEHFEWLERKFELPLRKDLAVWPRFIELTERRNLFVHTGGKVSSQYLKVCREHAVEFSKDPFTHPPKVGDELGVTSSYFKTAHRTLYELGFKLSHVLWRKLKPDDRTAADEFLLDTSYEVLLSKDFVLAQVLLDFATETLKKHSSEDIRRRFIVNRAQAYKWAGDEDTARRILDREDWTAVSDEFSICVAVLRDDFAEAASIMRRIGPAGKPNRNDYREWPLFSKFRTSTDFQEAYQALFGEAFADKVVAGADDAARAPKALPVGTQAATGAPSKTD